MNVENKGNGRSLLWLLALSLMALVVFVIGRRPDAAHRQIESPAAASAVPSNRPSSLTEAPVEKRRVVLSRPPKSDAAQLVAAKLNRFTDSRLALVRKLAAKLNIPVPADVEQFFDALKRGNWEEIQPLFERLKQQHATSPHSRELDALWRPILETYGVAEQTRLWGPQQLLEYGNSIINSLSPGMVYLGGTDAGCFIPLLMSETADGASHLVLTQNALSDSGYLDYLNLAYSDQIHSLTTEDHDRIAQDYLADLQKRQAHDTQFPDEPKQVRPGEEVKMANGVPQYSSVADMLLNEQLLQAMIAKNPDLHFAMEESYPFKSIYDHASMLGPIVEIGSDGQGGVDATQAAQTVAFWQAASKEASSWPDTPEETNIRSAYAKMALAQAGLLQAHDLNAQAEQTYRYAVDIAPTDPEAVFGCINYLVNHNRASDAVPILENAVQLAPNETSFQMLLQKLKGKLGL